MAGDAALRERPELVGDGRAIMAAARGDELNALLPERFFTLQNDVRERARQLVAASGRHDRAGVAEEFGALSKSCVACHEVYLFETGAAHSQAAR